jgi:hypothetical protein
VKIDIGKRLVPTSGLLSAEATLTRMQVPSFAFSLIQCAELEVTKVACHVSGPGVVDGGLVVFLYLCRFLFLSYYIEDSMIGNDFSFEGRVGSCGG